MDESPIKFTYVPYSPRLARLRGIHAPRSSRGASTRSQSSPPNFRYPSSYSLSAMHPARLCASGVAHFSLEMPSARNQSFTSGGGEDAGTSEASVVRKSGILAPFRRIEPPDEGMRSMGVDVRFVAPRVSGHPRLLTGMVLANRPWELLPSFKGALAAAFATRAYALVTPTIWTLSDTVGWSRHLLLMVVAIVAMVA